MGRAPIACDRDLPPELFTAFSAVTVAAAPNIAVADALGRMMLIVLDEANRDEPIHRHVDQGHILTAGFGVILIGTAGSFSLLNLDAGNVRFLHFNVLIIAIDDIAFVKGSLLSFDRGLPGRSV